MGIGGEKKDIRLRELCSSFLPFLALHPGSQRGCNSLDNMFSLWDRTQRTKRQTHSYTSCLLQLTAGSLGKSIQNSSLFNGEFDLLISLMN